MVGGAAVSDDAGLAIGEVDRWRVSVVHRSRRHRLERPSCKQHRGGIVGGGSGGAVGASEGDRDVGCRVLGCVGERAGDEANDDDAPQTMVDDRRLAEALPGFRRPLCGLGLLVRGPSMPVQQCASALNLCQRG